MRYKGVVIEPRFHLTSTSPGGGTLSITEVAERQKRASHRPTYINRAVVSRISLELGCSVERAEALFADLVDFLWMASLTSEARIPTPAMDQAWHVFLLFTKDYAQFCADCCGSYMHHEPHTNPNVEVTIDLVAPTIDHMDDLLGGKPSANWDYSSFRTWKLVA